MFRADFLPIVSVGYLKIRAGGIHFILHTLVADGVILTFSLAPPILMCGDNMNK